jgi:hypothetical protein
MTHTHTVVIVSFAQLVLLLQPLTRMLLLLSHTACCSVLTLWCMYLQQSLSALAPAMATVIRGGSTLQITAADVVRGDVVILNTGDKVTRAVTILKYYSCT